MSIPDSMLEPLGQFLTSRDSSWLWKHSGNSGLLSRALEMLRKLWTTFPCSGLCLYAPGLTYVVAQALLVSGLTSTLVP